MPNIQSITIMDKKVRNIWINGGLYYQGISYEFIEYIDNPTGSYINTGLGHDSNTVIEVRFSGITDGSPNTALLGSRTSTTSSDSIAIWLSPERFDRGSTRNSLSLGMPTAYTWKLTNNTIYLDGNSVYTFTATITAQSQPIALFAINTNGTISCNTMGTKIYSYKRWDSDVLTQDFKPARRNDGILGFYDAVSKNFFAFANS